MWEAIGSVAAFCGLVALLDASGNVWDAIVSHCCCASRGSVDWASLQARFVQEVVRKKVSRPSTAHGTFLRVLQVNDVHILENYPKVKSAIRELKEQSQSQDCKVIAILPGNMLSPCTMTSFDNGAAMLQALNEVGFDYVMFGNHEFDLKPANLKRRLQEYQGTWINSNVTEPKCVGFDGRELPEFVRFPVGDKTACIAGFLLDDMDQFKQLDQPTIEKPEGSILRVWEKIEESGGCDVFLPMTHLSLAQDRQLIEFVRSTGGPDLVAKSPVFFGAHDHEVCIEQVGKSTIFKAGANAENIGIVDIWWTESGEIRKNTHVMDVDEWDVDFRVKKFVDKRLLGLGHMMTVPIMHLQDPPAGVSYSTKMVRFQTETLVSILLRRVKDGMRKAEVVFLQGGNVRGSMDYKPGPFTYRDLMRELGFETQMAFVELPGAVMQETIKKSRSGEGAKPFFLHCDADVVIDTEPEFKISSINGLPFDPARKYMCATYQFLLSGLGNLQPMLGYVQQHHLCPPLKSCCGIKNFVIEVCMEDAWKALIYGDSQIFKSGATRRSASRAMTRERFGSCVMEWERKGRHRAGPLSLHSFLSDSRLDSLKTPEEDFMSAVRTFFSALDKNGDGVLDTAELTAFLESGAAEDVGGVMGAARLHLVKFLIASLDANDDGKVSLEEICALTPHLVDVSKRSQSCSEVDGGELAVRCEK